MSEANAVSNNNGNVWTQALLLCLVNLINYMDRYTVSGRALPKIISFLYIMWPMSVNIFQHTQVTSKKNGTQEKTQFLAQFSMPFHMVCSVLLRVFA